jgi:hypothetical protein
MQTNDFNKPVSSKALLESIQKQFGMRVNLEKYNREQLEDMRNKLRTKVFQHQHAAGFNDLLTNEQYQKDQAMLLLLNTRIKEMLGEQMKKLRDKIDRLTEAAKPDFLDLDKDGNKKEPMKKAAKDAKKMKEAAKPDFLDLDKDGNKKEPMKKAAKDAKKMKKVKEAKCDECGMWESRCKCGDVHESAVAEKITKKTPAGKIIKDFEKSKDPKFKGKSKEMRKKMALGAYYGMHPEKSKKKEESMEEGKPSAGLSKEKKSAVVKKAKKGGDIGKKGKAFASVAKDAAKRYGSEEKGKKVAAAAMWKNIKREHADTFKENVKIVNESIAYLLKEDEEAKAKTITAAGDIVNNFTTWMQRVGQYQTKTMIELADEIKANFGPAESEQFKTTVGEALRTSLEVLTQQREVISHAVATLAGGEAPMPPMGAEPPAGETTPPVAPDELNPEPTGDEFGASDAAAGAGTTGRELRESAAEKLARQHSIISKLAQ